VIPLFFICTLINPSQISCDGEIHTTDDALFVLTIILAFITGGSIIVGIWLTEKIHRRITINDSKKVLKNQLESIEEIIRDSTLSVTGVTTNSVSYAYTPIQFDTVSYDSLVSSGNFQKFDLDKQQIIVDYFSLIDEHNYILKEIDRLMPYLMIKTVHNFKQFMDYIKSLEVKLSTLEHEMLVTLDRIRTALFL
jgi:hypothetical protein